MNPNQVLPSGIVDGIICESTHMTDFIIDVRSVEDLTFPVNPGSASSSTSSSGGMVGIIVGVVVGMTMKQDSRFFSFFFFFKPHDAFLIYFPKRKMVKREKINKHTRKIFLFRGGRGIFSLSHFVCIAVIQAP